MCALGLLRFELRMYGGGGGGAKEREWEESARDYL